MSIILQWGQRSKHEQGTEAKWQRSLFAFIKYKNSKDAADSLGIAPSTLLMHVSQLEAKYEEVLERNERGWRLPVLNEYGKEKYNEQINQMGEIEEV